MEQNVSLTIDEKNNSTIISTFILNNMEFGIDVKDVREAILLEAEKILDVPTSIDIFEGIINLRDNIIPILDLRKRFGLDPGVAQKEFYVAIVKYKNRHFGLKFDDISQVIRCEDSDFSGFSSEDEYCSNKSALLLNNGERLVQFLDLDILFKDCNLPMINNELDTDRKNYLEVKQDITFLLNNQEYSIEIKDIREIINVVEIKNKIKNASSIRGVISLRGEIITIIDFNHYLFKEPAELNYNSRIIILNSSPVCGILVDSVREIVNYEVDKLINIKDFDKNFLGNFFSSVIALGEDRNVMKLNIDSLIDKEMIKEIDSGLAINKDEHGQDDRVNADVVTAEENQVKDKDYILFELGEVYAIDINNFQEIIKYTSDITKIPKSKPYMEGMLNLRGELVFVVNLKKYYNLKDSEDLSDSKILVLNHDGLKIGIIVDDILEILKTDREDISIAPKLASSKIILTMKNHIDDILLLKRDSGNGANKSSVIITLNAERLLGSLELEKDNVDGIESFIEQQEELIELPSENSLAGEEFQDFSGKLQISPGDKDVFHDDLEGVSKIYGEVEEVLIENRELEEGETDSLQAEKQINSSNELNSEGISYDNKNTDKKD